MIEEFVLFCVSIALFFHHDVPFFLLYNPSLTPLLSARHEPSLLTFSVKRQTTPLESKVPIPTLIDVMVPISASGNAAGRYGDRLQVPTMYFPSNNRSTSGAVEGLVFASYEFRIPSLSALFTNSCAYSLKLSSTSLAVRSRIDCRGGR